MPYSKAAIGKIVLIFFARRGMLPVGTTGSNWRQIKMKDFQFDDPPISTDTHFVKRKISQELMAMFEDIGLEIPSPLAILKGPNNSMQDLIEEVHANGTDIQPLQ